MKKMRKMVATHWIQSSKQVGYMLKKFQIIWNCKIYRRKKEVEIYRE